MYLSVIIPTCNRNDLLKLCLDQLKPGVQTLDSNLYEVIVTDDSTDELSKQLIQGSYPWVKWVKGPRKGPAANRNNGARHGKGDWLVFTDDDCLPIANWLSLYAVAISNSDKTKVFEGCTIPDRSQKRYDERAPVNETGNRLWSCNFAIPKNIFFEIGEFDESFPYAAMEDADLQKRILNHTEIIFLREAKIIHPWRKIKPFKDFKKHLVSHRIFKRKHNTQRFLQYKWSRVKILLGDLFFETKLLIRYKFTGIGIYVEKHLLNICLVFI